MLIKISIIVLNFKNKGRGLPRPPIGAFMNSAESSTPAHSEARCECGQLIAKLRRDGVELKCKRCKRIVVIPYSRMRRDAQLVPNVHL